MSQRAILGVPGQSDQIKQDIFMFGSFKSKFVNFTRFPVIFDTHKPYDAIYKRAFVGAFLSDVNQDSYRRLDFYKPPAPLRPNADGGRSMRQEYTWYRMKNAIPKRIDDQNILILWGFRMIFTNPMNGIRTTCGTRK
jgi:hypothetical protein